MEPRIYIASSWKNAFACKVVVDFLASKGFKYIDCFCYDKFDKGRFVFDMSKLPGGCAKDNAAQALERPEFKEAFREDKYWLDWANTVLLVLPAGRSAHLEAGYAKGRGKRLFIMGEFPDGEWDVMYAFADGLFKFAEGEGLVRALRD